MDQQRLGGTVEDPVDEIPHHGADDFAPRLRGPVDVGAVGLILLQVFLLFEDLHHGHDRGVGHFAPLQQRFVDVADGDGIVFPDDLHDFQFLLGENRALAARILII